MWTRYSFASFIMRFGLSLIIAVSAIQAHAQNANKKKRFRPSIMLSTGAASDNIVYLSGITSDWKLFQRTKQREFTLIGAGVQFLPWLVGFGSLEYNSFEYSTDLANYRSRADNIYSNEEIVEGDLISEHERNKLQQVVLPTIGIEICHRLQGHFYMNYGLRLGRYKRRNDYYYRGAWGHNQIDDGLYQQIEVNTFSRPKERSKTTKTHAYILPEWRTENWRIGLSIGFQFKDFRRQEFTGMSLLYDYSTNAPSPSGIYAIYDYEIGVIYGLKLSYILLGTG